MYLDGIVSNQIKYYMSIFHIKTEVCPVKDYPLHSGLDSLAGVIDCEGSLGYTEDKYHYGYMWNITQSQNLSWRFHSESQTGR